MGIVFGGKKAKGVLFVPPLFKQVGVGTLGLQYRVETNTNHGVLKFRQLKEHGVGGLNVV